MNIELTKQEADALMRLLDIAVKAGGLAVSPNALIIADKLIKASAAQPNVMPINIAGSGGGGGG